MALDAATAQEMLKQLADDRTQYFDTLSRAHDVLAQALAAASSGRPPPRLTTEAVRRNTGALSSTLEVESVSKDSGNSIEEDSDTDDDESLFVQQTLPKESYDEEGLRKHVKEYEWTEAGRDILGDIAGRDQVVGQRGSIFPTNIGEAEDRSHLSHDSILNGMFEFRAWATVLLPCFSIVSNLRISSGQRRGASAHPTHIRS